MDKFRTWLADRLYALGNLITAYKGEEYIESPLRDAECAVDDLNEAILKLPKPYHLWTVWDSGRSQVVLCEYAGNGLNRYRLQVYPESDDVKEVG